MAQVKVANVSANGSDPNVDKSLMDNTASTGSAPSSSQFEFPLTLTSCPDQREFIEEYDADGMDLRIERHLASKFALEIASFSSFRDDTILRFVTGYRHLAKTPNDYAQRLSETEKTFKVYIKWRRSGDMDNILSTSHINKVAIGDYVRGAFVYGQDRHGHPIMWDQGLKLRKGADLSIHRECAEKGMDGVLAYIIEL